MIYQTSTAIIGGAIAALIFFLVRRNRLHPRHAFWWLPTATLVLVLGLFPRLSDLIAPYFGISYPPMLVVVVAVVVMLIKLLLMDIDRTRAEVRLNRLIQEMAILEARIKANENRNTSKGASLNRLDKG
jgi:hypothetical protein